MSWNDYVTSLEGKTTCTGEKVIKKVAICSNECGQEAIWAKSTNFELTNEELHNLLGNRQCFRECGPSIEGKKCMMLKDGLDDDGIMNMRTKDVPGKSLPISVGKSKKTLIITVGEEGAPAGVVTEETHKVINYLNKADM